MRASPNDPRISPVVELWKGVTKYAGLTVMAAFAAVGFLHHIVNGPNRVAPEDEKKAKQLTEGRIVMSAYDVEPGDNVHAGDPVTVDRYTLAPASTTGSRRRASCCCRCPGLRSSIRSSSS